MNHTLINLFTQYAVTYDCNAYGASTYNNTDACTTTGGTTDGTSGGKLAYTGQDVLVAGGAGLALLIIGAIILVRLRRSRSRA